MASTALIFDLKGNSASALNAIGQAKSAFSQLEDSLNKLNVKTKTVSFSGMMSGLKSFGSAISDTIGKITGFIGKISTLQSNMLGVMGVKGGFDLAKSATHTFASFEEGLAKVKAVTGATSAEMGVLENLVKKIGLETKWTPQQVLGSAFTLGTLGVKPSEMKKMLPVVANYAIANDISPERAADILLSTMHVFGKSSEFAEDIADKLTNAYTNSAMNAENWAVSMQYAGLAAKAFNADLTDVLPLIMAGRNQGLDPSILGTQIRTAFLSLLDPKDDAMIAFKKKLNIKNEEVDPTKVGFIGVLKRLEDAHADIKELNEIFNVRGAPVIGALMTAQREVNGVMLHGTDAIRSYQSSVNELNSTLRNVAERQKGYFFSVDVLASGVEIFAIQMGKIITQGLRLREIFTDLGTKLFGISEYLNEIGLGKSFEIMFKDPAQLEKSMSAAGQALAPIANAISTSIAFAFNNVVVPVFRSTILPMMKDVFVKDIWPAMVSMFANLVDALLGLPKHLMNFFIDAIAGLKLIWYDMKAFFSDISNKIKSLLSEILISAGEAIGDNLVGNALNLSGKRLEFDVLKSRSEAPQNRDKKVAELDREANDRKRVWGAYYDVGRRWVKGAIMDFLSPKALGFGESKQVTAKDMVESWQGAYKAIGAIMPNLSKAFSPQIDDMTKYYEANVAPKKRTAALREFFDKSGVAEKITGAQVLANQRYFEHRQYQRPLSEVEKDYYGFLSKPKNDISPGDPYPTSREFAEDSQKATAFYQKLKSSGMGDDAAMKLTRENYGSNVQINVNNDCHFTQYRVPDQHGKYNSSVDYGPRGQQIKYSKWGDK